MTDFFDLAPCGLFSFDEEGRILQANDTLCGWLHMEKAALIGQKIDFMLSLPALIFYQTHFYPLLKMQHFVNEVFFSLKTSEGKEVPVLVNAVRKDINGRVENICGCMPVHTRKKYEDEILAARRKAEKALQENTGLLEMQEKLHQQIAMLDEKTYLLQQRNEELKELSYIISHNMQEPVRKLCLFADLLLHHPERISAAEGLKKIIHLSHSIQEKLLGLLDFTNLDDTLTITENDLDKVVRIAWQRVMNEHPELDVKLKLDSSPKIKGDFNQLVTLFYELIANSVKFRSPDRLLTIQIESTILNRNQFMVMEEHFRLRDYHRIIFSDNGIGFPVRYEKQLFQLFKKMDRDTGGLGMGLTICKKIIANHRGDISATGTEGAGATFTIYLPVEPF